MSKIQAWVIIVVLYLILLGVVLGAIDLGLIVHQLYGPHGLPVHLVPSGHASP